MKFTDDMKDTLVVTCGRDWSRYIMKGGFSKFTGRRWGKVIPIYATKVYQAYFSVKSKTFRFRFIEETGSFTYWKTAVLRSEEYARHYNLPYFPDISNHKELVP